MADNWQPIETAPRDGSEILILAHGIAIQARFVPGEWHEHHEGREYYGPIWCAFDNALQFEIEEGSLDSGRDHHGQVTHWQPLPEPPEQPMNNPDNTAEAVPSLKPCPFCSCRNTPEEEVLMFTAHFGTKRKFIKCNNCGAKGRHVPLSPEGTPIDVERQEAVDAWNAQACEVLYRTPEPKGDAEAMCQKLERMWFDPAAGARVFINPDGPEAAAFIRSLQQRNAELETQVTLRISEIEGDRRNFDHLCREDKRELTVLRSVRAALASPTPQHKE